MLIQYTDKAFFKPLALALGQDKASEPRTLPHIGRLSLSVTALHIIQNPLKGLAISPIAGAGFVFKLQLFAPRAVEDLPLCFQANPCILCSS